MPVDWASFPNPTLIYYRIIDFNIRPNLISDFGLLLSLFPFLRGKLGQLLRLLYPSNPKWLVKTFTLSFSTS
jgi:hypothetical protein